MEASPSVTLEPQPAGTPSADSGLRRSMGARHLVMIAMGGVIGSGLFLSSGYTISQAGPLGAVIAYLVGALVVYLVMACLGALAIAYPVSGAFHIYAARAVPARRRRGPGHHARRLLRLQRFGTDRRRRRRDEGARKEHPARPAL